MAISLPSLPLGYATELVELQGEALLTERLMDMGFHPGVELEIVGRMPFSGPLIIRVEASFLALREEEALCLKVQK